MLKIGLTGGIASGKSLVSQYFVELGIPVIDADKIALALFAAGSPHLEPLKEHFGPNIFNNNNQLIRNRLAEIVFNNAQELKWLNDFTHPLVNLEMLTEIQRYEFNNASYLDRPHYLILDIPLLVDQQGKIPKHLKQLVDHILVVDIPMKVQVQRIQQRDNMSRTTAMKIINSQSSREQKLSIADKVINNTGTKEDLKKKVFDLHEFYGLLAKQAKQPR
jgi:dephospho-CoA kinase